VSAAGCGAVWCGMVRKMMLRAMAALLLSAAGAYAARSGGLAVTGFGVRSESSAGERAELGDVAAVAGQLLGLDLASRNGMTRVPVSGDLMKRPKVCVVIAVDGLAMEDITAMELGNLDRIFEGAVGGARFFHEPKMFSIPTEEDVEMTHPKLTKALSHGKSTFAQALQHQFPGAMVISAGGSASMVYALPTGEVRIPQPDEDEVTMFQKLASELDETKTRDSEPDMIVLSVSEIERAREEGKETETIKSVAEKFDTALPAVMHGFDKAYGGRAAFQIVLLGDAVHASVHDRLLQSTDGNSNSTHSNRTRRFSDEEIADYLIQSWTAVVLAVFTLLIFLCIPWGQELDPMLYASLGKEDTKKDT